jgi:hypothetical protein
MGKSAFSTWLREVLLMSQIGKFGLFDKLVPLRSGRLGLWLAGGSAGVQGFWGCELRERLTVRTHCTRSCTASM